MRRPTKDVDAEAIRADVTAEHVERVVRDVSEVDADDGFVFDLDTLTVQEIREGDDYPGLRVRVKARLGTQASQISWDISTGDPIVPEPRRVRVPRVLGDDIEMWGYAPETIIAEKGVTILERGITSTRWRDYVDIVRLADTQAVNRDELRRAAEAVARHRGVDLQPIGGHRRVRRCRSGEVGGMAAQGGRRSHQRSGPGRPDGPRCVHARPDLRQRSLHNVTGLGSRTDGSGASPGWWVNCRLSPHTPGRGSAASLGLGEPHDRLHRTPHGQPLDGRSVVQLLVRERHPPFDGVGVHRVRELRQDEAKTSESPHTR